MSCVSICSENRRLNIKWGKSQGQNKMAGGEGAPLEPVPGLPGGIKSGYFELYNTWTVRYFSYFCFSLASTSGGDHQELLQPGKRSCVECGRRKPPASAHCAAATSHAPWWAIKVCSGGMIPQLHTCIVIQLSHIPSLFQVFHHRATCRVGCRPCHLPWSPLHRELVCRHLPPASCPQCRLLSVSARCTTPRRIPLAWAARRAHLRAKRAPRRVMSRRSRATRVPRRRLLATLTTRRTSEPKVRHRFEEDLRHNSQRAQSLSHLILQECRTSNSGLAFIYVLTSIDLNRKLAQRHISWLFFCGRHAPYEKWMLFSIT